MSVGPPPYYHRSDCRICQKQDGLKTGSALLDVPRPGGYIVEREHFVAEHAPLQESSAGTVILEARRHLLDFAEMTPAELAEVGSILNKLVPAIKAATGVQRVYYLAVRPTWRSSRRLQPRSAKQRQCRTRSESCSTSPDGGQPAVLGRAAPGGVEDTLDRGRLAAGGPDERPLIKNLGLDNPAGDHVRCGLDRMKGKRGRCQSNL
jgi:hypothetical protein